MDSGQLDYHLPRELIAQAPSLRREDSRLLVLDRKSGLISHHRFRDLPGMLTAGDCLALNNSRVVPCRILGRRAATGGKIELLLLESRGKGVRRALVNPYRRFRPGERLLLPGGAKALCREWLGEGYSLVSLESTGPLRGYLARYGRMPTPPYIKRDNAAAALPEDSERYQTVFAQAYGSAAAPTAGLHFSRGLLTTLKGKGVSLARLTLHVGPGTFRSELSGAIAANRLEAERFVLGQKACDLLNNADRVIAVGTTACRTVETMATQGGKVKQGRGATDLFIYPGYKFKRVAGLVTNFHLPRSSLLALVCAFAGRNQVLAAYEEAKRSGYRFYSYGDAMLII
jgi:S-adenosylmethionine:tRNA ribosyltransferase-isomerase